MNHFETILTGSRAFGKSFARDQWLKDQPLNSKIKMIYAHTHYARVPNAPALTQIQFIQNYLHLHGIETREIRGKLYAYDEYYDTIKKVHGGQWVNATAWTLQDARDFLGY